MGIFSSIFGAKALKSANKKSMFAQDEAFTKANAAVDPYAQAGNAALPAYKDAIGLGNSDAAIAAFKGSPDYLLQYDADLKAALEGVRNMQHAAGMANSGNMLKALGDRAAMVANRSYQPYKNELAGVTEMGLNVAGRKADLALGLGNAQSNYYQNKGQIKAGQMAGFDGLLSDAIKMAGNFVMPGSGSLY